MATVNEIQSECEKFQMFHYISEEKEEENTDLGYEKISAFK